MEGLLESFQPDLILLDLHMPEMDGFAVLNMLNMKLAEGTFLPVIVLTASQKESAKWQALKLGAIDFVSKPFSYEEVALRVRNHLRTRELHQQLQEKNRILDTVLTQRSDDLHRTEVQLRASEDKILKQLRLNAMGEMAAGIAHDFNNSISVIKGHSEMMTACPEVRADPREVEHAFSVIKSASDDAASIVRRLREFYRPLHEWEETGIADLKSVCREVIPLTKPKWNAQAQASGRQIRIVKELESVHVRISSSKIREALINLIFNAVDAMPAGGTITLRSRRSKKSGVLEVIDTGTGMSEEVRSQCLKPFYSTKGENGTGLGLGVVAGLVKRHHGELEIESSPGIGTTIRLSLPEKPPDSLFEYSEDEHQLDRHLHILLVDDEPDVRSVLINFLRQDGHTVVGAGDGREAMARFHAEYFDLVITDCAMPNINGIQLAAAIKKHAPNKPILMISGLLATPEEDSESQNLVELALFKPVGQSDIRRAMKKLFPPVRPSADPKSAPENLRPGDLGSLGGARMNG